MPPKSADKFVGQRLRQCRTALGITQIGLGEALGLSFQQIKKYESGINRISACTLFEAAKCLQVPVSYFFDGLEPDGAEAGNANAKLADFWLSAEGRKLAAIYTSIEDPQVRSHLLALLAALAADRYDAAH